MSLLNSTTRIETRTPSTPSSTIQFTTLPPLTTESETTQPSKSKPTIMQTSIFQITTMDSTPSEPTTMEQSTKLTTMKPSTSETTTLEPLTSEPPTTLKSTYQPLVTSSPTHHQTTTSLTTNLQDSEEEDVKYLTFDITERTTKSPGGTKKHSQTITPITKGLYGIFFKSEFYQMFLNKLIIKLWLSSAIRPTDICSNYHYRRINDV